MNIHESAENYLEMILMMMNEKGYARSVDIAYALNVSKPSVSVAMKQLRENGYIEMDKDNLIYLTDKGLEIARRIYDRHMLLTKFLETLGVNEAVAKEDACKLEQDISDDTYQAIIRFMTAHGKTNQ